MGRSFESMRIGAKDVSARWLKASKALKKEDQVYGQKLADMAKKHSSEAFYDRGCMLMYRHCCKRSKLIGT